MEITKIFELLKSHTGSHKAAARHIGMSYTRYNEWRWMDSEKIPSGGRKLLELAAELISNSKEQ